MMAHRHHRAGGEAKGVPGAAMRRVWNGNGLRREMRLEAMEVLPRGWGMGGGGAKLAGREQMAKGPNCQRAR